MKSILLSILFLFVPKLAISQYNITANDDAVYLDSLFNMGTKKNYKYIRVVKDYYSPNQKSFQVKDYYKSGKIAMSGTTSTRDKITKNGMFVYYYENGNKKSVANFIKNGPVGKESIWHENGNKKQEGEYIVDEKKNETKYKVNLFWDVNGLEKVTDGNGDYEESSENFFASGKVKNGFKDGVWEGYDKKIGYTFSETYENQKLISGISIDSDGTRHEYYVMETKPKPKKDIQDFYNYIGRNFNYTKESIKNKIKGKIIIEFVVNAEGKIIEPLIKKGLGFGLDEESIRVITNYENWIPGEQRGRKVRCSFAIPISIETSN